DEILREKLVCFILESEIRQNPAVACFFEIEAKIHESEILDVRIIDDLTEYVVVLLVDDFRAEVEGFSFEHFEGVAQSCSRLWFAHLIGDHLRRLGRFVRGYFHDNAAGEASGSSTGMNAAARAGAEINISAAIA